MLVLGVLTTFSLGTGFELRAFSGASLGTCLRSYSDFVFFIRNTLLSKLLNFFLFHKEITLCFL